MAAFPVSGEAQFRAVDGAMPHWSHIGDTRPPRLPVQERDSGAVVRRCMVPLDCACARGCVGIASRVPAANPRHFVTRIASEACTRWKDTFLLAVRYGQVVTECWRLRPRAMQVVNCAAGHGQQRRQAVARRDSRWRRNTPNSHENKSKKRTAKHGFVDHAAALELLH